MNSQSRSAEIELLLCCARTHLDGQTLEQIKVLLQQSIDWQHLIRTALMHGVMPLLYRSLQSISPDAIPTNSLDQLRKIFRANVQHNIFLTAELIKLLTLFKNDHIKAITFKGPVLAASVYRDLSLRQFGDLDILVQKKDILRGVSLILSQGYRGGSEDNNPLTNDPEDVAYLGPRYYTFFHPERQVRVDLQWRVAETCFSFSLDKDRLWQRVVAVSIGGKTVLTFAPTDLLLILCVHGSKHRWEKLKWMCDVAELVRLYKEEIDWGKVQQEASEQGVERMLGLGLLLAQGFLGTALPEEISIKVQADSKTRSVAQRIREQLFAQANEPAGDVKKIIFYLRTKDRWLDRLEFCLRYLFQCLRVIVTPTSKERAVLPLPTSLSFVYFFFRPLRLTAKHCWLAAIRFYRWGIREAGHLTG